jgi:hypothetical protein
MKKFNFEIIKKIDYVLVLVIALVGIVTFLVEKISSIPKHKSETPHISIVDSDEDYSHEETKESVDFLEKIDDVYIFEVSTKAIKSDELGGPVYSDMEFSNSIGQSYRQSSSQTVNFIFVKDEKEYSLFPSKAYIYKYELKSSVEDDVTPPVYVDFVVSYSSGHDFNVYAVVEEDSNGDKKLDSKDNISLYVSDYDGKNIQKISSSIYYYENVGKNKFLFTEYKDGKISFYEFDGETKKTVQIKTVEQEITEKRINLWR